MHQPRFHRRRPLSRADFAWVQWTKKDIAREGARVLSALKQKLAVIKKIPDAERTFENTLLALDRAFAEVMFFGSSTSFISTLWVLGATSPNLDIQKAARTAENNMRQEVLDIERDTDLYAALRAYAKKAKGLDAIQKRLLATWLCRFEKMGFALPKAKQRLLKKYGKELATAMSTFQNNLADYDDFILVTKEELDGLSDNYIATLSKVGEKYKVGLAYPEIGPFLSRAKNRKLRFALAEKNAKKGGKENVALLTKMATLRHNMAKLLGYKNHFAFKTEDKAAKNDANVREFYDSILKEAKKTYSKELQELVTLRNTDLGIKDKKMYAADAGYYTRILKESRFSIDYDKIREYFPLEPTITAVFTLFEKLFNLTITEVDLPKLHPDIMWYEFKEKNNIVGYLCLDLFPRPKKYDHMCAETFRLSFAEDGGTYRTPCAIMVGNFTKPSKEAPSLISHGELTTFLHEMGHLVHALTSDTEYASHHSFFTPIDFVEMPSQLFEHFGWHPATLPALTNHYKTGEQMPKDMIENLIQTEHYREASFVMGQLELGMLDYALHTKIPTQSPIQIAKNLKKKMTGIVPPNGTLWPASFGHMREYDAGYYSYLWTLVRAEDMWTRFAKEGVNKKLGMELKEKVLKKGASADGEELMKNFLGRKPNNKAFLRRFE